MRKIILLLLLCFCQISLSQNLVNYKFGRDISISIPADFEEYDTLKQVFAKAYIGNDFVMLSRFIEKDTTSTIEDDEDLFKFYDGIKKGILAKSNGKTYEEKIVKIKGLYFLKLRTGITILGQSKFWDSYTIYLNNYIYSVVFLYNDKNEANFISQKDKILSSIKFAPKITKDNQYNHYDSSTTAYRLGQALGSLLVLAIPVGIILLIIFRMRKKRKFSDGL